MTLATTGNKTLVIDRGTVTLAAMLLRIHSELRSERYQGRRR